MPYKDKDKNREYQREWARKNRSKQRNYNREVRLKVLKMLGNICVYCGCDEVDALEINHINGGGRKDRQYMKNKKGFLLDILKGRRTTEDLELTCRICNAWHYLTRLKGIEDKWIITYTDV